jgi:hypothetical protein
MGENALALALDLFIFRKITDGAWNRAIHLISPTDLHHEDSNLRNCLLQSPAYLFLPYLYISSDAEKNAQPGRNDLTRALIYMDSIGIPS